MFYPEASLKVEAGLCHLAVKLRLGQCLGSDGQDVSTVWETWVQPPCWEDPVEGSVATQSSILSWRISMDRGAWWATVMGSQRVGHN